MRNHKSSKPEQNQAYLAYLLRLWQVQENGMLTWRASLEASQTGKRMGFTSLEELIAYLRMILSESLKRDSS